MFHDIIRAYADAMYVATTLRPPPVSVARSCDSERFAGCEERRRARPPIRPTGWVTHWLRTSSVGGRARQPSPQGHR